MEPAICAWLAAASEPAALVHLMHLSLTTSSNHPGLVADISRTDQRATRHAYGPHPEQYCELYRPEGHPRRGTIALLHGGFWRSEFDLSRHRPLADHLADGGWTVWNIEYRRVGDGGGWPNTLTDVASAIDKLAEVDVDYSKVIAIGHSAGGQLATWAAARPELSATAPGAGPLVKVSFVVSQAGVLDLQRAATSGIGDGAVRAFLGGLPGEVPERYTVADPRAHTPSTVPIICVHSRQDEAVPFSQSETFVAVDNSAGGRAELVEVTGDHLAHRDPSSSAWAAVVARLPAVVAAG